ncbi:tethering complex subunit [Microbotryomycetes sp. JL201]|nr:tethering complex subunit [Microbotryomycetes sp. JL201]
MSQMASQSVSRITDQDQPMFSLGRVQFALASPLFSLACNNNILLLALTGAAAKRQSDRHASTQQQRQQTQQTAQPQLVRIDLDKPDQVETIDLPVPHVATHGNAPNSTSIPTSAQLHKVHSDPTGRHVIISFASGDNFYVFVGPTPAGATANARKPKPLSRIKGAAIESVAWCSSQPTTNSASSGPSTNPLSTREILLGTRSGQIIETCILDSTLSESSAFAIPGRSNNPERYVKVLFSLPERQGVTGLRYETWSKRAVAIATTSTRIYQFAGGLSSRRDEDAPLLESLFQPFSSGNAQPKTLDLPGDMAPSELHFFATQRSDSRPSMPSLNLPSSVAWLTGPGIYHGSLVLPTSKSDSYTPGDGVIESASLVPYPPEPTNSAGPLTPISMALTEWHIVLLYNDKLRVLELMSDKVVYEEPLDLPTDVTPRKLATDPIRRTCWMYTDQSIFELVIKDEDRNVWKTHLSRSNWELAHKYAKSARQRETVLAAEAESYFASGRYIQSAQAFAQSSRNFEDVVLKFVDKNERDALRYYLVAKLERLKKTDITQRMMLATWLVEIYLSKLAQLEDAAAAERTTENATNLAVEKTLIDDELRQFLVTYKQNLDERTVFDLLAQHGRDEIMLYYANLVGDIERVIEHWISEENWYKVLEALSKQDELEYYYRYAPTVYDNAPADSVDAFMRQPTLDVRQLIPALCPPRRRLFTKDARPKVDHAIRFLQYSIMQLQNTDTSVHNAIITLFATNSHGNEADFLHFLSTCPSNPVTGDPYYDLDYALRICRANKCVQACVLIYSKMGLFESSVDLALDHGDLELAKMSADKPEDDDILKKKLWLKIARYVVGQNSDIRAAMRFLESTDLVKIEDVLPFFPDFVVVDDFKEEICNALEDYSSHIDRLKKEMDDATQSAEEIKRDIADLRNRFVVVDANDNASKASNGTRTRNVVEDQTLKLAQASVQGLDQLRKLVLPDALLGVIGGAIPTNRLIGASAGRFAGWNGTSALKREDVSDGAELSSRARQAAHEQQELRRALDELLASSCPLCHGAVNDLDKDFVEPGEEL